MTPPPELFTLLSFAVDSVPGLVAYVDAQERYQYVNRTYEEWHGRPREAWLGRTLRELLGEVAYRPIEQHVRAALAGKRVRYERSLTYHNGLTRFIEAMYEPHVLPDGQVAGFAAFVRDITARHQAEQERAALVISNTRLLEESQEARARAEEASRLKDEFLATLSHELRTPLTSMLGWVQMLRGGILTPEKQRKAFEIIERNTHAQVQLVEDILDVSRIITGKLRLEVRPVELAGVVEAAVESVRPAADARGVAMHVLVDSALGPVLGDPTRLQQIIWNLLSNAVKFTPKGGRVRASVEKKESVAIIQVTDTGRGIAPDFLPHVFERFRQADSTTTRTYSGLGLGLAIVKHLVEQHGGSVEAFSEGLERGATFTVRLPFMAALQPAERAADPRQPEPESPEPASLKAPPGLVGLRVLVVDDEEDAREMLRILLSNCGLQVSVAASSLEGLEVLRRERPEVVVSDIGMPGEDGYTFLQKLRALAPEEGGRTPAVALTAYSRAEDRTRALRAGFNMHLPKPVEPSELLLVLASVTGRQGT